jgi:hypothetical protein
VVVYTQIRPRDGTLQKYNGQGFYHGRECAPKKKFKGFPMFLHLKNLKTAFVVDIKQWLSCH